MDRSESYMFKNSFIVYLGFFLSFFVLNSLAYAQNTETAEISAKPYLIKINNEESLELSVLIKIPNNRVIFAQSQDEIAKPSSIFLGELENIKSYHIAWPSPETINTYGFSLKVYKDSIIIPIQIELIDKTKPLKFKLDMYYSLCQLDKCMAREYSSKFSFSSIVSP